MGYLLAASLRNFGPVSNILCEWVYDFIIDRLNEECKKLPELSG